MDTSTDRIQRSILIHAPRARTWQALSDAEEFGHWFGVDLERVMHFLMRCVESLRCPDQARDAGLGGAQGKSCNTGRVPLRLNP